MVDDCSRFVVELLTASENTPGELRVLVADLVFRSWPEIDSKVSVLLEDLAPEGHIRSEGSFQQWPRARAKIKGNQRRKDVPGLGQPLWPFSVPHWKNTAP